MNRLSPLDSSFLHIEDDVNLMHIGSVAIMEGPPPPHEQVCGMVLGKLPLVPRYRQRVRFVPMQVGRPVWVDDPHFNIGYHVRHTALPSPGGANELRNLVGRIMSQKLDRSKPLWEMWMVEGLEEGHWALVSKVHHCLVDGVAGTDLMGVIMDTSREPSAPVPDSFRPEPDPTGVRLVAEALADYISTPYEQYRAARSVLRRPVRIAENLTTTAMGLRSLAGLLKATPESGLNGPIGPHRRYVWARTTLADIKKVRSVLGGTVNDVVLTAITRGFRDLLLGRGESVADRVVRTLVPVSVRLPDERGVYNNRVSAVFAELPVGIEDAEERLQAVRSQMDELKTSNQAVAAEVLTSLSGFAPPVLLSLGTRLSIRALGRFGTRNVNTVTTNVPGPQQPLYAAGRRMVEAFPYVPVAAPMRVGVAIFSYDGKMSFGITGDFDTAGDIGVLARGVEDAMTELMKIAER